LIAQEPLILPKNYYDWTFKGNAAHAGICTRKNKRVNAHSRFQHQSEYFSLDQPIEMGDGTPLSSPADINGQWQSAAGSYEEFEMRKSLYRKKSN
jgi:hypothetical protein